MYSCMSLVTFIVFPGMIISPLRVVSPGEEGKLRRGGGGGGDFEGFSVRYLATVSSSEPRLDPPSLLVSLCWGLLGLCSGVALVLDGLWLWFWFWFWFWAGLICLAAKSKSGMAFMSSAWVSSKRRLMSWALYCVRLALFSSQSRSAAWGDVQMKFYKIISVSKQLLNKLHC